MIRTLTDAEKGHLRTRPQRAKWYLAVHRPASIYHTQLASAAGHWPTTSLVLSTDSPTGNVADTASDMTVFVGSTSGGSEKGRIRLRDALTTTNAKIAEAGSGLIDFAEGDHFTVMNLFEPYTRFPRVANLGTDSLSAWVMDYSNAYTDQFENWVGTIRMGPPAAAIMDGGTTTINYVGTSTQWIDTTLDTASWIFPDGGTDLNIGAEHAPVARTYTTAASDGKYHSLQVTGANGAVSISRRLTFVFEDETQLPEVEWGSIKGGIRDGGYTAEFVARSQTGNIVNIPHRAEIVIFESASYGPNATSVGGNYPFRENIVFRGWVTEDPIAVNPFSGEVRFKAETVDGIMKRADSFDIFHFENTTPDQKWVEMPKLTVDKVTVDLAHYRSTIANITDVILPSANGTMDSGVMFAQDLPRSSLWNQFKANYHDRGILGYFASDTQGNLHGFADVNITGTSGTLPTLMHIRDEDKRDTVTISTNRYEKRSLVRLLSIASTVDTSGLKIGAESPGHTQGYFGTEKEISKGIVAADSDTLIIWAGNMRAKENMEFPKVNVPLSSYAKIDPVPQSIVTMSMSATDNPRGIIWDDKEFLPYGLALNYDSRTGIPLAEIEMEEIVNGIGGSSFTFPTPDPVETPDLPPPPPPPPIVEIPVTGGDGLGTVYVMTANGLARTLDLSAASPSWSNIHPDSSIEYWDFILDPWAPKTKAYLATSDGVYKSENMDTATPTWTLKLSRAAVGTGTGKAASGYKYGFKVLGSINQEDYLGHMYMTGNGVINDESNRLYFSFSEDGGDSWTHNLVTQMDGFPDNELGSFYGSVDIVPHTVAGSLRLYATIAQGLAIQTRKVRVYRSDNKGDTWSKVYEDPVGGLQLGDSTGTVQCPYAGNEDGTEVIAAWSRQFDGNEIYRSTDSGVSWSALTNIDGGVEPVEVYHNRTVKRFWFERATNNTNNAYAWELNALSSAVYLRRSTTGITGTFSRQAGNGLASTRSIKASGGFPYNDSQFYLVEGNGVYVTLDGGTEWLEKTGDLDLALSSTVSVARLNTGNNAFAPYVIVPVWVD
jgi:hypothetical protein